MKRARPWTKRCLMLALSGLSLGFVGCGSPQIDEGAVTAPRSPVEQQNKALATDVRLVDDDPEAPPQGVTSEWVINDGTDRTVKYRKFEAESAQKIIGVNDLLPVTNDGANLPAELRPLIDAFGMLDMGCSATHIGNGLVLTAGHCFNASATPATNVSCAGRSVRWGFRKDKSAYMTSQCQVIVAQQLNDDTDYAILRVSPIPPVAVEVDLSARPANETRATIFGHPQMRPLEWSQYCTVQPGSKGNWGASQFSHQCDTEPGNSGSSVIDAATLKVIGIHDGGLVPWNYATYVFDTPLAGIIGGGGTSGGTSGGSTGSTTGGTTGGGTNVPDQTWGPFANNLNQTLITLGAGLDKKVSFHVVYNVENTWDFVYVTDATGKERKFTGNSSRRFTGNAALQTPVTIRIVTDSSVASTSVGIHSVSFR